MDSIRCDFNSNFFRMFLVAAIFVCWLWKVSCKSKVGSIGLTRLSICLNELLVGLDLPRRLYRWPRRGLLGKKGGPSLKCNVRAWVFCLLFREMFCGAPSFKGPQILARWWLVQVGDLDLRLLDRCCWLWGPWSPPPDWREQLLAQGGGDAQDGHGRDCHPCCYPHL